MWAHSFIRFLDSVVSQFDNIRPIGVNITEMSAVLSKNGVGNNVIATLTPNQLKELSSQNTPSIIAISSGGSGYFIVVDAYKEINGVGYYMIRDTFNGPLGIRTDFLYGKMTGNGVIIK
ncbi:hypothetical protein [Dickeya zeae]|uniref:hypothetical protein n=1 Tax=Dickeya zeae TaxID=204042 RepID=UPI0012694A9C|nr:hypothetical protein [Dickeya zeae]